MPHIYFVVGSDFSIAIAVAIGIGIGIEEIHHHRSPR